MNLAISKSRYLDYCAISNLLYGPLKVQDSGIRIAITSSKYPNDL